MDAAREETPLDLTVKSESSPTGSASNSASGKRRASGDPEDAIASKINKAGSSPTSPSGALPLIPRRVNGQMKPVKPERPIYRYDFSLVEATIASNFNF